MDLETKLDLLTDAARFDLCGTFNQGGRRFRPRLPAPGLADDGDRHTRPVFRALLSSACEWNCAYCPLRAARDIPRATLTPDELAHTFLPRYQAGAVQGLFLSTAVNGGVAPAIEGMLDAVEVLRTRYLYDGYVHIKLLPGSPPDAVERAARLADRLSLNLEAPGPAHLAQISPDRNWHNDLIQRLLWSRDWQRAVGQLSGLRLSAGLATQFVVGAAGEPDRDLLTTGAWLYSDLGLRRVYFGAFRPVADTPLAEALATPQLRVTRLQQADWLLRNYGFSTSELPFDASANLPLHIDPKLAWALANPARFPIELNSASPEELLRVPGFGSVTVRRIVRLRRIHPFAAPEHLASLGSQAHRALDFVTLGGRFFGGASEALKHRYAPREQPWAEQLRLWE